MTSRLFARTAVLAAIAALSSGAQAALTVYTTQSSFLAAITSPGVDTFAGTTGAQADSLSRTAGSYAYTATSSNGFYGVDVASNPALSTNFSDDSMVFGGFSASVSGVGGNFFGTDINGAYILGDVKLVAVDSLGATSTQTITGATTSSFFGFKSTGSIASLTVSTEASSLTFAWPTVDNLTVGVSPVPEPATYALALAGLAVVGAARLRRRT